MENKEYPIYHTDIEDVKMENKNIPDMYVEPDEPDPPEKEFNLKRKIEEWADKWIHKKLTGRAYKELRDIEKEFIKIFKGNPLEEMEAEEIRQLIDKLAGEKFA